MAPLGRLWHVPTTKQHTGNGLCRPVDVLWETISHSTMARLARGRLPPMGSCLTLLSGVISDTVACGQAAYMTSRETLGAWHAETWPPFCTLSSY